MNLALNDTITFSRLMGLLAFILSLISPLKATAQELGAIKTDLILEEAQSSDDFPVVAADGTASSIHYDANDFKGVVRAIKDLQSDIYKVTNTKPALNPSKESNTILIGTLGKSQVIEELVASGKLKVNDLKGKWERFIITSVNRNGKNTLVIAGSDQRGTIYGIYELSRQLGVSPWYWWADVPVKKRPSAYVKAGRYVSEEPKVRYRGIFINDEEPAFGSWSREKFGEINSEMYGHMFELLLRLRANYLWPAMWGKAFNEDDPLNPKMADAYGIVMGTSHHEPMMRSQKEWNTYRDDYGNGEWNYKTNEPGLKKFWREGLERNKDYEQIVTMAMRGDGDLPMEDAGSAQDNFRLLEKIMTDQRKIIADVTEKPASKTPQIWALYSEVLEYYDQGIKVPEDIIILLSDDNWGDVRRLPELDKKPHPGGYGIYYHVDLHGAPRAYQWLNMTQIPHMWEQLQLTYSYGVDKVWILNVGDLKPNEYPMDFFLNMAWDPTAFNAQNLDDYAIKFCADKFGEEQAQEAAEILIAYCKYNSRITAEMLDENTYNLENGEFLKVKDAYLALEAKARRQFELLAPKYKDAYKELILHPVRAMANLYEMYYAVAMNKKLAKEKDIRANYYADLVEKSFRLDSLYSRDYNKNIADGKWDHMMDQTHIGYTSWDEPKQGNIMPGVERVKPEEVRKGGYVFTEKNDVVVMEAEHYFSTESPQNTNWTVIPNLGRTLSAIALMLYTEEPENAAIYYKMKLKTQSDSIKVRLIFDSTLPFSEGGHRVSAGFDNAAEKTFNINKDLDWDHNYSKMYPAAAARIIEYEVTLPLEQTADNMHVLKLKPLDAGVVFQKIIVDDGGYEKTHLKMDESPYHKNL